MMDKNKRQIIILICLLAFIANYSVYTYYVAPQLGKIESLKKTYEQKVNKLNLLQKEKARIDSLKKNVAELKVESEKLDTMAPREIDTPKLIYDFYNFCKLYGVTGESVKFQLQEGSQPQSANGKESTKKSTTNNNSVKNSNLTLISFTIDLSVKGNKGNIGNMLNNLNTITDRKLNVKNIVLATADIQQNNGDNENSSIDEGNTTNFSTSDNVNSVKTTRNNSVKSLNLTYKVPLTSNNVKKVPKIMIKESTKLYADGIVKSSDLNNINNNLNDNSLEVTTPNNNSNSRENKGTSQSGNGVSTINSDEMTADIIFVQYIQISNDNYEKFKSYRFFDDSDKGFENFSDMFK